MNDLSLRKRFPLTFRLIPFVIAAGWLAMLTWLLILPGSSLPHQSWMADIWLDKWVHIFLFGVLLILWIRAVGKKSHTGRFTTTAVVFIAILAITYGIGMEFIQKYFVAGRSFEIKDILADTAGAAVGAFIGRRYIKK